MFPFDLRGPEFLLFYFGLSLATILGCWMWRRFSESGDSPRLNLADPYLIAYLRGGANETIRIATISLVERNLLKINDKKIERSGKRFVSNLPGIESALLEALNTPTEPEKLFKNSYLKTACEPYQQALKQVGLLPTDQQLNHRALVFTLAVLGLVSIGAYKARIGLANERPVLFLVIMIFVAVIALAFAIFSRLTPRGQAMLADVKALYGGLLARKQDKLPQPEVMMVAAVFGIGALGGFDHAYAQELFPRATQSHTSGCGSSGCGSSSCSSGSGCGGGGGCGGCSS